MTFSLCDPRVAFALRLVVVTMSHVNIRDGLVRLTHALVEDVSLRSWFLGLESHSAAKRQFAFTEMARQMRTDGEDPELATAVLALSRSEVFDAVRNAVRDRCGS